MTVSAASRNPMEVTSGEHGLVRLFATELDPEGDAAITRNNVARLLGPDVVLDPSKVEVTTTRAIEALGLTTYLVQGYGIAEDDLRGKAAALDALKGLIILVPSSAFRRRPQTLDPNPAVRFIGVFREEEARPPELLVGGASSEGTLPVPDRGTRAPHPARRRSWIGALGALLIAALLVLLMVF